MRASVRRTRKGEGIKSNSDVLHVCDLRMSTERLSSEMGGKRMGAATGGQVVHVPGGGGKGPGR